MEYDQQPGLIASHVAKTLASFRNFEGVLSKAAGSNEILEGAALNNFLLQIRNELTRFKMWVGNQAAHQSGSVSLDYRLREAAHLQQQVIYLLEDICESLQTAASLVHDDRSSLERNQQNESSQDNELSSLGSGADDESDFSDLESDEQPGLGISTLLTDIREAVDCLLRLSVAIANPAPHERFRKLGAGPAEDISFYEPHDIAYVRDKFPTIANQLADALGKFITRRRQFFKYRYAHHEKLASGIESVFSDKETEACHTEIIPKTVASSLPDKFKTVANFDPYTSVIDEDTRSDAGMTQTSYATSAGLTSAGTDQAASILRVPPRPSAAEDGVFECPFCYRMIVAKTRMAWKRHVFGDLRPYTCVFSNCVGSNLDFDRRRNWQLHVSKYHWRSWSCPFECQQSFPAEAELTRHIRENHLPAGTYEELKSIASIGERAAPPDTSYPCHLCGQSVKGLEKHIKHVGWHLEQLALFSLPDLEREDLEEESATNESRSSGPEDETNSPHVFSAVPSPVPESNPVASFGSPGKGKKAAVLDNVMDDTDPSLRRRHRQEDQSTQEREERIRLRIAEANAKIAGRPVTFSSTYFKHSSTNKRPSVEIPTDQMRRLSFEEERRIDKAGRLALRNERKEEHAMRERLRERLQAGRPPTQRRRLDVSGTDAFDSHHEPVPPVSTPDGPANEQEMKRQGGVPDHGPWSSVAWPQTEGSTNKESNKQLPTQYSDYSMSYSIQPSPNYYPSYPMPPHLQSIKEHHGSSVPSRLLPLTEYPGYSMPADLQGSSSLPLTLQSPADYPDHHILAPQQNQPRVQATAEVSTDEWPISCLHPGCTSRPFKRKADLERHYKDTHSTESNRDAYLCDYRDCTRSHEPFHRRDHFRDHLREYHGEDISKREASSDMGSGEATWWRCPRCFVRVYVSDRGYECPDCKKSKSVGKRRS